MLPNQSIISLMNNFNRLNIRSIHTTAIVNSAPKRKTKTDATVLTIRIEKKRRKFQRIVDQLERQEKIKIPLIEYVIDKQILKNLDERTRKNADKLNEIKNELERLNVVWSLYKCLENSFDNQSIERVIKTKLKTLKELNKVSPKLYEDALQLDDQLFPFKDDRIIKETVANKDFKPNDGQIVNVTKVWKIEI